jgi:hypothetical protein
MADSKFFRLILASVVIAIKATDDFYYSMSYYAKVGGVRISELRCGEVEFLNTLDFGTFIIEKQYYDYLEKIDNFFQSDLKNHLLLNLINTLDFGTFIIEKQYYDYLEKIDNFFQK